MSYIPFKYDGDMMIRESSMPNVTGYGNLTVEKNVVCNRMIQNIETIRMNNTEYHIDDKSPYMLNIICNPKNNTVKLPNATTLKNGWSVNILNNNGSSDKLIIKNFNNVFIKHIFPGRMYELYLSDNSTASGTWTNFTDNVSKYFSAYIDGNIIIIEPKLKIIWNKILICDNAYISDNEGNIIINTTGKYKINVNISSQHNIGSNEIMEVGIYCDNILLPGTKVVLGNS